MKKPGLVVAVVGARGMVGREMLRLLDERRFPVEKLLLFGSGRKKARALFQGRSLPVRALDLKEVEKADLALLAVETEVAERIAPRLVRSGVVVVDESAAFRMDKNVPLVIPEINGGELGPSTKLVAGPNCTTAALLMGLYPLHRAAGLVEIRSATYQAVSGAGRAAVDEFLEHVRGWRPGRTPRKAKAQPHTLAFNVFPQIGGFAADGYTGEEAKIAAETRKILASPKIAISATAVRVPVLRGHSIAAWVKTRRRLSPARALRLLAKAEGVKLLGTRPHQYPTALMAHGTGPVYVGRVRAGTAPNELLLWIVADNLLKGAALNSVQIAEHLLKKGWLRPRINS